MKEFLILEKKFLNVRHIIEIIKFKKDEFDYQGNVIKSNCYRIIYKELSHYIDIQEGSRDYTTVTNLINKSIFNYG